MATDISAEGRKTKSPSGLPSMAAGVMIADTRRHVPANALGGTASGVAVNPAKNTASPADGPAEWNHQKVAAAAGTSARPAWIRAPRVTSATAV